VFAHFAQNDKFVIVWKFLRTIVGHMGFFCQRRDFQHSMNPFDFL
jgi:hypothetical protein